jgi:hypothetical protein
MEGSENKKMRLRWVRISPTLSDETVSFRVEGCAGMRLHEFIQTVLSEGSSHCGTFQVYAQSQELGMVLGQLHVCDIDYRGRKVYRMVRYFRDSVLAMDALVSSARCNGGWGQMNYDVVIAWKGGEHAEA